MLAESCDFPRSFRTSTVKMYWWLNILIALCWTVHIAQCSMQSSQWPIIMLVNLAFNSSEFFIWIYMTTLPPYRVDDELPEAQREGQILQIKVYYTKSSYSFILQNFQFSLLCIFMIPLNLFCSQGRIHSVVCDRREMMPDLSMEWKRLIRHLLRVRIIF